MEPDSKIEKREPFQVPEGYFESLTDRIIRSMDEANDLPAGSKVRSILTGRRNKFLAIAAVITGVVIISAAVFRFAVRPTDNLSQASLIKEAIAEDLDVWTIENELIESESLSYESSDISYDLFESIVIENVEETDIYEL